LRPGVVPWYAWSINTTISIPDPIFKSADALAGRLGVSRSELYARAAAEYVARHRDAKVAERLNAVYGAESHSRDPALRRAAKRTLGRSKW
jgi:hypothetical protein